MLRSAADHEARKESPQKMNNSVVIVTGTGRSRGGVYARLGASRARDLRLFEV
jgi:hypothetical protein